MSMAKKIFLIGGTGRTGWLFAEGCLDAGHSVTAVVRRDPPTPGTLQANPIAGSGTAGEVAAGAEKTDVEQVLGPAANLNIVKTDINAEALEPLMQGHDVVVAIIGAWPKVGEAAVTTYSDCAKAYTTAMQKCGITRFFTVFGAGFLGPEVATTFTASEHCPEMICVLQRDMRIAYDLIVEAGLGYTIWCPANFPNAPRSDKYTTAMNSCPGFEVTTGMVADSMVKELTADAFKGQRVGIARAD